MKKVVSVPSSAVLALAGEGGGGHESAPELEPCTWGRAEECVPLACVRRPSYPLYYHCCLLFVALCGSLGLNSESSVGGGSVRKIWLDANISKTLKSSWTFVQPGLE